MQRFLGEYWVDVYDHCATSIRERNVIITESDHSIPGMAVKRIDFEEHYKPPYEVWYYIASYFLDENGKILRIHYCSLKS
jgi:hypothetical protein